MEEGLGIAALEAMAMQKPVIVSDVGGLKEVVSHEKDGLRVPFGDVETLLDAIIRLQNEPEFAARLGKNAHTLVNKKFTLNRMVNQIEEIYEKII